MHGAAHTANAPPSSAREPLPCARWSSPGATARSGQGRTRRNARPSTTRTKPAISTCDRLSTVLPTAAAAAPSSTNTAVKPITNGTLASSTRFETPWSPSRSTSTAETADRYPGTSGRTHGVTTERSPARNAIGSFSTIEPVELVVDPPLHLRAELGRLRRRRAGRRARPVARTESESDHAGRRTADREHPGEEIEAVPGRRREDTRPEVGDHLVDDLLLGPALRDPLPDLGFHLLGDR